MIVARVVNTAHRLFLRLQENMQKGGEKHTRQCLGPRQHSRVSEHGMLLF